MLKPRTPWAPIEPQEYFEQHNLILGIPSINEERWTIDDLAKNLPKGIGLNDLRFATLTYPDDGISISYIRKVENPHYKRELKRYQKEKDKYDKLYAEYEEQLKAYTAWEEAEELTKLEKRIAELKKKQVKEAKELEELSARLASQNGKMEELNKGAGKSHDIKWDRAERLRKGKRQVD